jgi:molybdopterin-guanine dinucleotide biosynthesis protein A
MPEPGSLIIRQTTIGAILAGGLATRFGSPKCLARRGDVRLIDQVLEIHRAAFGRVIVVSREGSPYEELGVPIVEDIVPRCGPLGGIHAALSYAHDHGAAGVCISPCDAPLLEPALLRLLDSREADEGAILPKSTGPLGFEPLFGWYSSATLSIAGSMISAGEFALHRFVAEIPLVRFLSLSEVANVGDPRRIFFNVNSLQDLETLEEA